MYCTYNITKLKSNENAKSRFISGYFEFGDNGFMQAYTDINVHRFFVHTDPFLTASWSRQGSKWWQKANSNHQL